MPVVHVHIWKGISEERIKEIIEGITNVFVDIGISIVYSVFLDKSD